MTRLLVECTYVFEHPEANSGIQRVVRNVITELPKNNPAVECIPVVMLKGALYQVTSLAPLKVPKLDLMGVRVRLEQIANRFWLMHRTLERRTPFRQSRFARLAAASRRGGRLHEGGDDAASRHAGIPGDVDRRVRCAAVPRRRHPRLRPQGRRRPS